jgi:hypothetical protein
MMQNKYLVQSLATTGCPLGNDAARVQVHCLGVVDSVNDKGARLVYEMCGLGNVGKALKEGPDMWCWMKR